MVLRGDGVCAEGEGGAEKTRAAILRAQAAARAEMASPSCLAAFGLFSRATLRGALTHHFTLTFPLAQDRQDAVKVATTTRDHAEHDHGVLARSSAGVQIHE